MAPGRTPNRKLLIRGTDSACPGGKSVVINVQAAMSRVLSSNPTVVKLSHFSDAGCGRRTRPPELAA